ncbi:hypothetical protein PCA20602_03388 [Pandoraea capi]|uniref:SnoaL-like domain-containing protein n=1 Tax=Pandoraea capi TaxID=2508286 RepID=A0ABY6W4J0_9BURK|nr:nuclear transport factor 2 family protein [Pandoraea capi]VVE25843.1 hypothetical protein PCA20602_03388 [Pandoraea capi]
MFRQTLTTFGVALACAMSVLPQSSHAATSFSDSDREQVTALFAKQANAATAHDLAAFESVLANPSSDGTDPVVFVARAYRYWGKAALVEHFRETFKGVWKFEPDMAQLRIVALTPDVAQLYAPTQITLGHTDADARTAPYLVYEVAVRTTEGWRIGSIVPIAAQ